MNFSMDDLKHFFHDHFTRERVCVVGGALVVGAIGYHVYSRSHDRKRRSSVPKDVVLVHGTGRGPYCPCLSPFVLKIETYFRMNRIPYQSSKDLVMSSQGKVPWVEYNGEIIEDSGFIIKYFNKKMNIDVDRGLSHRERAVSRAFHCLIEDNLLWCLALSRWVYNYSDMRWMGLGWFLSKMVGRVVKKNAWCAGIGRHSQDKVEEIFLDQLKAVSDFLGDKKFMMGSEPTELDCTTFGMLAQLVWHSPKQPAEVWIKEKFPNLLAYCLRMKETFWKDWDDCITHGGTREATR